MALCLILSGIHYYAGIIGGSVANFVFYSYCAENNLNKDCSDLTL